MSETPYPYAPPPGGSAPRASGPPGHQPESISPKPRTVSTAITLVWVAIGLYLVGVVVLVASGYLTDTLAATETAGEPVPPAVQGFALVVAVVVGGFFLLLYVGFGVLLALMLRAGRSWPRIVLAVVAGLFALGLVLNVVLAIAFAVNGPSFLIPVAPPVLQLVISGLEVAALAAAVVLLFQRPSSAWFAERRDARLRAKGQVGIGLPGGEGRFAQGDQRPDLHR